MASSCCNIPPIIVIFVGFLLVVSVDLSFSMSTGSGGGGFPINQTFRYGEKMEKMKRIRAHLKKINKAFVKTIKSPDGDLIDCVLSHQQPAFDHPKFRGQNPVVYRPERPKGLNSTTMANKNFQLWTISGESCPNGTIPIRRTSEKDIMRASSVMRFGKKAIKPALRAIRRDSSSSGHEHAIGYVMGDQYYGAKASLNVWSPHVANGNEFSLSQMWVISGSFHGDDLNTIEAGWQVSPELYGDNHPRFFTYWTDPKRGHWWLQLGSGPLIGYWPSFLFSHLANQASMVQFGGEIVNTRPSGFHTSTQMGSGHFPQEGFKKSSYFRNLQVVDWDNNLLPPTNLRFVSDHPNCYDIKEGSNRAWGVYFYYGGPGRNVRCP